MKINIKLNKNNYREKSSSKKPFFEQGFTFLEFIFVVTLLGITSTLVIPFFKTSLNKSRQKEASFIVNSMIKSTQSYYGIYGFLPEDIWQLSKFSKYQKCVANDVENLGRKVCKNKIPNLVERNELMFFSPSGNYKIEMNISNKTKANATFLVKANPNGNKFRSEGLSLIHI